MIRIAIASDHRGVWLKDVLIKHLRSAGYYIQDFGCAETEVSVDYPDYAKFVTDSINNHQSKYGILICGSGIGMSIAANRSNNIRAALCFNEEMAKSARQHNDANIIVFGANYIDETTAILAIDSFLNTDFEGGRHQNRINKLS